MKILKYIPSVYFIALLFSTIIYFFSKLNSVNILLISIIAFLIFISAIFYFFIKKTDYKLNYFLGHFSTFLSIYIINFFLILEIGTKSYEQLFEDKGVEYDRRSVIEYVNYLRKEFNSQAIYPASIMNAVFPYTEDKNYKKIIDEKGDMIILSSISNAKIVYCNEYGTWQFYESDNHGFNNPNKIITDANAKNITLLGDSFTRGDCSENRKDIGSKLRKKGFNVHNLGYPGGIIKHNVIYREFSKPREDFEADYVIMLLFFLNDIDDTYSESKNNTYKKYISNPNFNQDLIGKQNKADYLQIRYFNLVTDPNIIEKYQANTEQSKKSIKELFKLNKLISFIKLEKLKYKLMILSRKHRITKENTNKLEIYFEEAELLFKQIEMLNNEVSQRSKFIIVYLPSFQEIDYQVSYYSDYVSNRLDELNISNMTLYNEFINYDMDQIFYYGLSGHYSDNGYQIATEVINKYLKDLQ
tara:strand:- start:65 stop:1477 length:1413 start_codon:yes stop_codon:yes gene_type:complete